MGSSNLLSAHLVVVFSEFPNRGGGEGRGDAGCLSVLGGLFGRSHREAMSVVVWDDRGKILTTRAIEAS
jgi:hypothetical protein